MIALAVLLLSAIWLAFGFGYWPGPDDARAERAFWIALGIDLTVLLLGVATVLLSRRRKYPAFLATIFVAAPIFHFVIPLFGANRILFFALPFTAVALGVFIHYLRLLFRPLPAMRILRRRLLIGVAVYGILWAATALFGTRQVAQNLRDLKHIDESYAPVPCSRFTQPAPEHGWGCCAVSYAPFVVVVQYAYYDHGYSDGDALVFLWCGRSWLISRWPWGHSWIT
jgi:hypothetical protein